MGVLICMSTSLLLKQATVLKQTAAFFRSSFVFFSVQTLHMLCLSEVFFCSAGNTSLLVLYTTSAPKEAKGNKWGLVVFSTPLGSLLDQPHKLWSPFLLSASSPVCITLAPALQR